MGGWFSSGSLQSRYSPAEQRDTWLNTERLRFGAARVQTAEEAVAAVAEPLNVLAMESKQGPVVTIPIGAEPIIPESAESHSLSLVNHETECKVCHAGNTLKVLVGDHPGSTSFWCCRARRTYHGYLCYAGRRGATGYQSGGFVDPHHGDALLILCALLSFLSLIAAFTVLTK